MTNNTLNCQKKSTRRVSCYKQPTESIEIPEGKGPKAQHTHTGTSESFKNNATSGREVAPFVPLVSGTLILSKV